MLKYLTMIQDRKKVMNPNMLQAIAKQFEAAYIQNGGLFLANMTLKQTILYWIQSMTS